MPNALGPAHRRTITLALALAVAALASCTTTETSVEPLRKSIVIASARVRFDERGPEVVIEAEAASGSRLDLAQVASMRLARIELRGVNPMGDHVRGLLDPPLGWDPDAMALVATLDGPAAPRQVLRDRSIEPGVTYAYAVSYARGALDEPAHSPLFAVRIHPPETWWPTARVDDAIRDLVAAAGVTTEVIGHGAHRGLPIAAIRAGSAAVDAPTLVLAGAVHAGESGPELMIPALAEVLVRGKSDEALAAALARIAILAVPVVNVDERDRLLAGAPTYLRLGPQGIDINRSFPAGWDEVSTAYGTSTDAPGSWTFRGGAPLASNEARALHDAVAKVRVAALLSYHGLYSLSGPALEVPSATPRLPASVVDAQRGLAAAWLAGLTRRPSGVTITGSVKETSPGGSLPTWIAVEKGAPAFEIECGGDARLDALHRVPPDLALLDEYRARHADAIAAVLLWLAARP